MSENRVQIHRAVTYRTENSTGNSCKIWAIIEMSSNDDGIFRSHRSRAIYNHLQ